MRGAGFFFPINELGINTMKRFTFLIVAGLAALLCSPATAGQVITNGSFETGNFSGWTLTDGGNGGSEVTALNAPSNGIFPTPGASDGLFYAVTSQGGPGTHAFSQTFSTGGPVTSATLSFDMFVQTNAAETINPAGLTHTAGPNQHARVDILSATASALDTGAGVLQNFYIGIDGAPTQPYTSYSFDVTSLLSAGGTFQLRFAQSDNLGNFNLGVDNVSLVVGNVVPEPTSLVIFGLTTLGLVGVRRRRS